MNEITGPARAPAVPLPTWPRGVFPQYGGMSAATASTSSRAFLLACGAALLAYALALAMHTSPVAAGSDSAGYLLSARLLTEGRLSMPLRTLPEFPPEDFFEYTPLGMIFSERLGALIPTYPIGLPLFHALGSTLAGWTLGPILVATLMACGAVVFTYLAARELDVGREIAGLAALALGVCPLVFFTTFQPMSDTASTCWNAAAVFCALRASRGGTARWSLAAGAALAITVLIRPANLLLLPVLVILLAQPRRLAWAFVGGLPGALFLAWYHHALYGSVLVTGYGSVWSMFGSAHVAPSLHKYVVWVPAFLPVSVLALALGPWLPWRTRGREIAALVLWAIAYGGFYAFYPPTHEHRWYLRFILPMFPALLILAALALEHALGRMRANHRAVARPAALALLTGITLASAWHQGSRARLGELEKHTDLYREIPTWADAALPREAILLTQYPSCSFYVYTERAVLRSDVLKPARFATLAALARSQARPVYAIVTSDDDERTLSTRLPGTWIEEKRFGPFGVWRLSDAE